MLLVGDIGGTKTNLAVFSPDTGPRAALAEATFPSSRYPSMEELVSEFLTQVDFEVKRASFGVAGLVVGGRARIINLPWVMAEGQLQEALKIPSVRSLTPSSRSWGRRLATRPIHSRRRGSLPYYIRR